MYVVIRKFTIILHKFFRKVQRRLETAVYLLCAQLFADQLQVIILVIKSHPLAG